MDENSILLKTKTSFYRWPWWPDCDSRGKDAVGRLAECEVPGLAELGVWCNTSRLCWPGDHRARHDPLYICACSATSQECGSVMKASLASVHPLHSMGSRHKINLHLKWHLLFNHSSSVSFFSIPWNTYFFGHSLTFAPCKKSPYVWRYVKVASVSLFTV